MIFLRRKTTILCRLRVLPGVNLRRKFCSTDEHLNDLNSLRSQAILKAEEINFKSFESANRGAIKKVYSMMNRYYHNPTVEASNAEIIGIFEYYNSEDSGVGNHPNVYRRSRSVSLPVIDRIQSRTIVPEKGCLVLDINNLVDAVPNMVSLSRMKPSMDHNLIAFSVDLEIRDHDEWADLEDQGQVQEGGSYYYKSSFFVKDLKSNIICRVDIAAALGINANSSFIPSVVDFEWAVSDTGSPILYVVLDDNLVRPSRVMFLNMGELNMKMFPSISDRIIEESLVRDFAVPEKMLYEVVTETDTAYNIDIGRSKDDKFIIISHQSKISSEVSLIPIPVSIDLARGEDFLFNRHQPVVLTSRQRGLKYYVDHAKGHFIVATNKPCKPPSISTFPSSHPSSSSSFYSSMFSSTPTSPISSSSSTVEVIATAAAAENAGKKVHNVQIRQINDDNVNIVSDVDSDGDLCIMRCSSMTALKRPQETSLPSFRRRGRKEEKPHPFAQWDYIYPTESEFDTQESDTGVGNKTFSRVINDFDIFKDKLVIYGRTKGFSSIHMVNLKKSKDPKKSLLESSPGSASLEVTDFTPFIKAAVGSDVFQIIPSCNGAFDAPEVKFCVSNPLVPGMYVLQLLLN